MDTTFPAMSLAPSAVTAPMAHAAPAWGTAVSAAALGAVVLGSGFGSDGPGPARGAPV